MSLEEIVLHGGSHAIEAANFAVVFRSNVDTADEGRFDDGIEELKGLFGSISSPDFFQIHIGDEPPKGASPILKQLDDFGRDGKATWSAQFGENAVALACLNYSKWEETWPLAEERLNALLKYIDQFKLIGSLEHSVTDTFRADLKNDSIRSSKIFTSGSWVPPYLLNYEDKRWDFSCGKFIDQDESFETLERVDAKSFLSGGSVTVSITNSFSHRFKKPIRLKELLEAEKLNTTSTELFSGFHERNKQSIRSILHGDLLKRMGL